MSVEFDVAVIGAGPSGSVASALLNKQGFKVCVLEKQHFPRFVIGESLLPHCMEMLEEAGFADECMPNPAFNLKTVLRFHGAAVTQISTLLKNFQTAPVLFIKCAAASSTKS